MLRGKNALITGAARGIGAAMTEGFAREGANVWAFARTPNADWERSLEALAGKYGVWVRPVYAELTDPAQRKRAFAQVMADRQPLHILVNNAGAMVNVASIAGLDGDSRLDYSASKAAVIAATKKMARELVSVGIRVNALAPGLTDTDLVRDLSDKVKQAQLDRILLHRMARPEEIANVAAFLASDLASYVTGQVWRVDGGML